MVIKCPQCFVAYDDAECWTVCPHGPLWAGVTEYCRKHDLVNCVVCKKEKMEERQIPQQTITTIQGSDYRDNYANSVSINVSLWDFFFLFGNIKHNEKQEVTILNFQGMFLSPQQAKALANVLTQNVKQYEQTFGEIKLSPKDQLMQ